MNRTYLIRYIMFRSFSPVISLILRQNPITYHYRYLTNLTSSKFIHEQTQSSSSSSDNNEWLWEYLRHRQSYQSLNEEQKRQVILLEYIDKFRLFKINQLNSILEFKHYVKVVNVYLIMFRMNIGLI